LIIRTDGVSLAIFFVLCGTQEGEWTRRPNVRNEVGDGINGAHSADAAESQKVNYTYGQCIYSSQKQKTFFKIVHSYIEIDTAS